MKSFRSHGAQMCRKRPPSTIAPQSTQLRGKLTSDLSRQSWVIVDCIAKTEPGVAACNSVTGKPPGANILGSELHRAASWLRGCSAMATPPALLHAVQAQ